MAKMSNLEIKIRSYLMHTENFIDIEALELIKMANLDEELNLIIPAKKIVSDVYKNYWKKFSERTGKKSPVETTDSE